MTNLASTRLLTKKSQIEMSTIAYFDMHDVMLGTASVWMMKLSVTAKVVDADVVKSM